MNVNKYLVLLNVCIGIFMSTLDGSIVNIANPTIASEFGIEMSDIQWVVTAYMLVVTATMLFFGKLGDKIGGQRIYRSGFLLFALGSLLCTQATTLHFLISARIFQAIGGSMLMATGIGIVSNAFPPEERGKALGLTTTVVGLGNISGPSIGGLIIAHFHWSMIFYINIPIGIIAFLLGIKLLPPQPINKEIKSFDFPGIVFFALSTVLLLININSLDNLKVLPLLLMILVFSALIIRETHFKHSFLDLILFRDFDFSFGNFIALFSYMSQMAMTFLLPFFFQNLWKFPTTESGLMMSISPVCMAITAPLGGSLSDKLGSRKVLLFSFAATTVGFIGLSFLSENSPIALPIISLMVLGTGFACFGAPNNSSILTHVPPQKQGYGGSFIATSRNLSFAMGTAFFSWLFTWANNKNALTMNEVSAYVCASGFTYRITALITVIGFILTFFFFEKKNSK